MANLEDLRIDSPIPKPRRRKGSPAPLVLLTLLLIGVGFYLFGDRLAQVKTSLAPAREVEVYRVPSQSAGPPGSFTAGGYIEVIPPGPTVVSALIAGPVKSLAVKPGDRVTAGQVVARLDASLLAQDVAVQSSQVEVARAGLQRMQSGFRTEEVGQAQADLAQAEARLNRAEADAQRYKLLYDQGIISAAEHDGYVSAVRQAEGEVAARRAALQLLQAGQRPEDIRIAKEQVDAARAQLARAQAHVAKATIKSPVAGVVLDVTALPGSWVTVGDQERAGEICRVFDPQALQAWVDVNQRDIGNVYIGQPAVLTTDVKADDQIAAHVSQIMPSADLQKNTVRVKVQLDKPRDYLRPEMSAQVTFKPKAAEGEALASPGVDVPESAVVTADGKSYVFVLSSDKAVRREVQLGAASAGQVRVVSGLGSGDAVITAPQGLADGQTVKTKPEAAQPEK
jgi:HlyD family secretion protein